MERLAKRRSFHRVLVCLLGLGAALRLWAYLRFESPDNLLAGLGYGLLAVAVLAEDRAKHRRARGSDFAPRPAAVLGYVAAFLVLWAIALRSLA